MGFPAITPAQAIQFGVAAQTVGAAASSAFASLLHSAADLLAGAAESGPQTELAETASTAADGVAVLHDQLGSLLRQFHAELKQLLGSRGLSLPATATLGQTSDGQIAADGGLPSDLFAASPSLLQLFRSILARQKLLDSTAGRDGGGNRQIRITPTAAQVVGTN